MRDATFTVSPNTQKRARSTPMTPDTTGPEATPTRMRTAPCDSEISVAAAAAWRSSANRSAARAWSRRAGSKPDTAKYESLKTETKGRGGASGGVETRTVAHATGGGAPDCLDLTKRVARV